MVHYFNPAHETAVQNASPYYTARASMLSMKRELAFLPAWYAADGDVVLIEERALDSYYTYLSEYLPSLPRPILTNKLKYGYKDAAVCLWGISPQAIHYFGQINKEYELNLHTPSWNERYTYLNGRQAARDCLQELIVCQPEISSSIIPQFFTSLDEIEHAVNRSSSQLLAKAPYSSSGRGLLWLPVEGLTRTERQILHGMLKKQGSVSLEVVLDKQIDFAMEFLTDGKGGVEFAGYSLFYTNSKGAYLGNYLGSQKNIEQQLTEKIPLSLLDATKNSLKTILSEKYAFDYKGCIGVDMLLYKSEQGYALHPCLEINMRYNMGFLAVSLSDNYLHPQAQGKFYIDFCAEEGDVYKKHSQMLEQFPPQFDGGRLLSGYLALCPVNESNHYWAYALID